MISQVLAFFDASYLFLVFLCHSVTFACSLYIAVHNRELRSWIITPLWYLGICSGFIALTVVIQWSFGLLHPISYYNISKLGEISSEIILAIIMFLAFVDTVKTDLQNKKFRK